MRRVTLFLKSKAFLALLVLFGILALPGRVFLLAGQAGKSPAGGPRVRTDGVYYFTLPGQEGSGATLRHVVVRLYDDFSGVEADVSGDPTKKANWLNRGDPKLVLGRWTLEGDQLVFTASSGFEEKIRKGRITEEGWAMSEKIVFRFLPVVFPKEAEKNHLPYFKGPGRVVRKFEYDAAGRVSGVDTECEVDAADADGDPLTFTWKVSNGSIVGEGRKIVWKREMVDGEARRGVIGVVVTDGRGGRTASVERVLD